MRLIGKISQALYTEAFTSFCQAYTGAMCSGLPRHHCLHPPLGVGDSTVLLPLSCVLGYIRDLLLDISRLLGLALRPFDPVFRCHWEIFATLEAGTCAGSRAWHFFSRLPFCLFGRRYDKTNSDSLRRISIQGTLAHEALNVRKTCFSHTALFVDTNIPRSCIRDTLVNART